MVLTNEIAYRKLVHVTTDWVVGLSPIVDHGLKGSDHFLTQSDDTISCYGKPVERTNEIAYRI